MLANTGQGRAARRLPRGWQRNPPKPINPNRSSSRKAWRCYGCSKESARHYVVLTDRAEPRSDVGSKILNTQWSAAIPAPLGPDQCDDA
jgi:hypothetical protein